MTRFVDHRIHLTIRLQWSDNRGPLHKTSETITGPLVDYSFTTGATGYDGEDRLKAYTRGTLDQQWNLSLEGDWNTFTENGVAQNRTHGPSHEVNSLDAATVTHDVKGNVTSKPSSLNPADTSTLTWDFDNRLTSVDTDSDGTLDAQYTYDAIGRRITKNNTIYVCNSQQVMAEYAFGTVVASPTEQYVYGTYIDEPVIKDGTGGLTYYHRNQQFSIIGLTDSAGNIAEHYAYDAYGDVTILDPGFSPLGTSVAGNAYTYTGRRYESETGDYFFRARYYDSELGRFLGRDSLGYIDGWSLYSAYFVLTELDPTGRELQKPIDWPIFPVDKVGNQYSCCYGGMTSFHCAYEIGPLACGRIYSLAEQAREAQRNEAELSGLDSEQQDAFRHCVWSCLTTVVFGAKTSKKALDLYEKCNSENDDAECKDLWNNAIGRSIGEEIRTRTGINSDAMCSGWCSEAATNGNLQLTETCPPGPENLPKKKSK